MNPPFSGERRLPTRTAAALWRKVRRSVKRRGEFGTVLYIAWYVTAGAASMAARRVGLLRHSGRPSVASIYDGHHGVETAEHVDFGQLDIHSDSLRDCNPYAPTSPKIFGEIMAHLDIRHQDYNVVDLGCGKGMVLLLAAEYPFRRIIGIEFSAQLVSIALKNLAASSSERRQCHDVQCVCMDATVYQFPREPLVIYLYNSFNGKVLNQVAANLASTIAECQRDIFVVYNNPTEPEVFDRIPSLQCVVDDPDFIIYRTTSSRTGSSEGQVLLSASNQTGS